jgi:predicted nucleic acid-binding protein
VSLSCVVDSSPLILLGKVDHLWLLPALATELLIPQSVALELQAGPAGDPARTWLASDGRRYVVPDAVSRAEVAAFDLGAGESAVLACALDHPHMEAVLDDAAGRRAAAALGVKARGTLGLILFARLQQVIPAAKPVLLSMIDHGFYLHANSLRAGLEAVGEVL